ncbi:MAG: TfoX/Sxy family protein [Clostridia bacterium]|nr:TfoX/Sxy family protein [Clostridia bacterium]
MASSKEFLQFVLEQLSRLEDVSARPMMGEYVLYHRGRVVGGIYDDRLLLKPTPSARLLMPDAETDLPYEGAKEMLVADADNAALTCRVIEAVAMDLPESKPKRKKGNA